jgi:antirestriction protein ArdC
MSRKDLAEEVTNQIISRLEEGGTLPWQRPWALTGGAAMPMNGLSKRPYNGINVVLLWLAAEKNSYTTNVWLTYKQAKQLGGSVRKGEKGHTVVFFKPLQVTDDARKEGECEDDDSGTRTIRMMRGFTVFNLDQTEGVNIELEEKPVWEPGEAKARIDALFEAYSANTGVTVAHGERIAAYYPESDHIGLPDTFYTEAKYVATFAHEIGHSTGHRSRFDRLGKQPLSDTRVTAHQVYAAEELVAEFFASLLCAELGCDSEQDQHVSYVNSWLSALKKDKRFVFRAAAAATKAYHYFLDGGVMVEQDKAA